MSPARPLSDGNRLQRAYHRWAAPHYARMAPEVREQAEWLDRFLYSRQGLAFWAGLLTAALGTLLVLQRLGLALPLAIVVSVLLWGLLPLMLLAAWLQPARFSLPDLRRRLPVVVAMALAGAGVGYLVGHVARHGRIDADLLVNRAGDAMLRLGPAVLLVTVAMLAMLWGVARVRAQMLERQMQHWRLVSERDAAARQAAEARLKLLQGQIQPHFIFNTLSAVQHWVDQGDPRGGPLLRTLTAFLRGSTEALLHDTVSLADEAAMVGHYLAIMQARLGARLSATIEVDPVVAPVRLPPGLLLTLVENAVEHGIAPTLAGGRVGLRAVASGGDCVLTVTDTAGSLPPEPLEGVGLANSRERLQRQFGSGATLSLALVDGATVVTVVLPRGLPTP
ncbi:MAG: histidine kinase [Ideonella sp.]|nr:histidine kinase [Ideonella sp.]